MACCCTASKRNRQSVGQQHGRSPDLSLCMIVQVQQRNSNWGEPVGGGLPHQMSTSGVWSVEWVVIAVGVVETLQPINFVIDGNGSY